MEKDRDQTGAEENPGERDNNPELPIALLQLRELLGDPGQNAFTAFECDCLPHLGSVGSRQCQHISTEVTLELRSHAVNQEPRRKFA